MIRAMMPGSFDPVTTGHMDIIGRAAKLFDEVIVCVFDNTEKRTMFSAEERLELVRLATSGFDNVKADLSDGLVADYARAHDVNVLVKGIRNVMDYEYEYMIAAVNRSLDAELETVFLPSKGEYSHVCSTAARDMIKYSENLTGWIPENVIGTLRQMIGSHAGIS